jgi:hypothetical protein
MAAIMESREQIGERLGEVNAALDDLIARPAAIADPLHQVGVTGFYMAYQGFDDTDVQRKIAQAYRLAAPALEWRAPHVDRRAAPARKIRLGIVSAHLTNHTIGKLNIGIAQKIDRERFEVIVMRPPAAPIFSRERSTNPPIARSRSRSTWRARNARWPRPSSTRSSIRTSAWMSSRTSSHSHALPACNSRRGATR